MPVGVGLDLHTQWGSSFMCHGPSVPINLIGKSGYKHPTYRIKLEACHRFRLQARPHLVILSPLTNHLTD